MWSECETGQELRDFESAEDGQSACYAVLNLGGADRQDIAGKARDIVRQLDYRFEVL